jgi:hypothetical protein
MPRPERALDANDGALTRFAVELRALREQAGGPGYRSLALRANYSAATLATAASGRRLPTLAVTLAYVAACGGDTEQWEARWRTLAGSATDEQADQANGQAPYRGLAAFDTGDASLFFGRTQLVADLVGRLTERRFLAVFGPSGVGKSSVLRAGLVPAADRHGLPGGRSCRTVVLTPGPDPVAELAVRLAALSGVPAGALATDLAAEPRHAHLTVRQALVDHSPETDLLLVVDQFEEVFTLCPDYLRREVFIATLLATCQATDSRARVVLGIRADFYARCAEHPQLLAALVDAQILVGAMDGPQIRDDGQTGRAGRSDGRGSPGVPGGG